MPILNITESIIDNIFRDSVCPIKGSIVYCDLAFGLGDHSGIYIGNNKITHLNGNGNIENVTPKQFMNRLDGLNSAISIYVSCIDKNPAGKNKVAEIAKKMTGKKRDYHFIGDNCHQFSSGCISGNFENSDNFLWMLKYRAGEKLKVNSWRVWTTVNGEFVVKE